MSGRATLILYGDTQRATATEWIRRLPPGTRVEFKKPRRSLDQNSLLWAILTEVSMQAKLHGLKLSPEDWKDVFTASLKKARIVTNLDGDGFVQLGLRTSDMTKEEMSNLIDLIYAYGTQNGVTFSEPKGGNHEAA